MRLTLLVIVAGGFLASCLTPKDPDLDPQPSLPPSDLDQKAWNAPEPGQGGGPLGMMPQRPRR